MVIARIGTWPIAFENRAAWPIKGLAPKKKKSKVSMTLDTGIAEDRPN